LKHSLIDMGHLTNSQWMTICQVKAYPLTSIHIHPLKRFSSLFLWRVEFQWTLEQQMVLKQICTYYQD